MGEYRFDRFRFDAVRGTLYDDGELIPLRPKTAALLTVLLRHAGQLVSKNVLIAQVWQRRQVQDQSLFQAISELRAALKPLDAIRTQPNLGYEWVLPLRRHAPRHRVAQAAAVALVLLANGAALLSPIWRATPTTAESQYTAALPALRAFSIGMDHLQHQRFGAAGEFFSLAAQEHPTFLEAQLMAAESLLAAGEVDDARARANTLMQQAQATRNNYLLMATLDLLSRADLADGNPRGALDLAREAAGSAREEGFACTAVAMEDRVLAIVTELSDEGLSPTSSPVPMLVDAEDPLVEAALPPHCAAITSQISELHTTPLCEEASQLAGRIHPVALRDA